MSSILLVSLLFVVLFVFWGCFCFKIGILSVINAANENKLINIDGEYWSVTAVNTTYHRSKQTIRLIDRLNEIDQIHIQKN